MIKLIIAGEQPEVESTVRFEFRRHKTEPSADYLAYLVGEVVAGPSLVYPTLYPIKINGRTKTVEVRRRDFEALGFTLVVKD
jgi:hypothetical protein